LPLALALKPGSFPTCLTGSGPSEERVSKLTFRLVRSALRVSGAAASLIVEMASQAVLSSLGAASPAGLSFSRAVGGDRISTCTAAAPAFRKTSIRAATQRVGTKVIPKKVAPPKTGTKVIKKIGTQIKTGTQIKKSGTQIVKNAAAAAASVPRKAVSMQTFRSILGSGIALQLVTASFFSQLVRLTRTTLSNVA
jgi:hypothetical protein